MKGKYAVKLNDEERRKLEMFIKSRAPICLDENGKALSANETARKCGLHDENIYKIRKQFATEGMDRLLCLKKRESPPVPEKITGEVAAHIIAAACGAGSDKGQSRP